MSVGRKVSNSSWKGPVTETLKLLNIGIDKLIKSKYNEIHDQERAMRDRAMHDERAIRDKDVGSQEKRTHELSLKSSGDPETFFFVQFGRMMIYFLASCTSIQSDYRRESLLILKNLIACHDSLECDTLRSSHRQDLLLEIVWILKGYTILIAFLTLAIIESTEKIWKEQKLNLNLQMVETELIVIAESEKLIKENHASHFPTWILDLWVILRDFQTDNSWILVTIAFATSFFEDLAQSTIYLLKIDIATDFNLIKSEVSIPYY